MARKPKPRSPLSIKRRHAKLYRALKKRSDRPKQVTPMDDFSKGWNFGYLRGLEYALGWDKNERTSQ
jgi:hypothetical protein